MADNLTIHSAPTDAVDTVAADDVGGVKYLRVSTAESSATIGEIADVTVTGSATLLRAANNNRVSLSGTNNHASAAVRVGSAAVTATSGQRVGAGAAFETGTRAAVYAISEGANVTVSLTEEIR